MIKWTSNAEWPLDVYRGTHGDGVTTDTHNSFDAAEAVCHALRHEGFGGQRKAFPLRTWIDEVTK